MDYPTNFSLKYTEFEDEKLYYNSCSDNGITNGTFSGETTPKHSFISSPMMFSRQSPLESLSTPSSGSDRESVESDYSYYISTCVSPSDIPDSPSEMIPQSKLECIGDDEHDDNLLESCLQLGIYAILHPNKIDDPQSVDCREHLFLVDEGSELINKEKIG